MANTYLTRTFGTPTSRTTGTFSFWIKVSTPVGGLINNYSDNSNRSVLYFGSDYIRFYDSTTSTEYNADIAKIRDCNGWYHIVLMITTADGTQADRVRIYINGVRQSPLIGSPNYNQNVNSFMFNPGTPFTIGRDTYSGGGGSSYFNGAISHLHYCDGQAYDASSFGETDSTTGEWKIKTSPNVNYGNQGFFILKDGNTITDSSPNSNNFSLGGGTLTKTEDNPSNVFATINPLVPYSSNYDFYNGNTTVENDGNAADWTTRWGVSTLGMSSGKFYAEAKVANIGTNQMYALGLVKDISSFAPSSSVGSNAIGYYSTGDIYNSYGNDQTGLASYTTNDIIGLAFDATNGTAQWYKNGSAVGTTETGLSTDGTWFFVTNQYTNGKVYVNYGNGYFGSTAVSSAGTNASGIGIFEYDVPTGFTALSTKGLNL